MGSTTLRRALPFAAVMIACSACGEQSSDAPGAPNSEALQSRRPVSEQVQQLANVSHLPAPANREAFAATLRRHYPAQFVGVRPRTAVLVDVEINASGIVEDVRVVDRSGMDESGHVQAVLQQKVPGTNQIVEREFNPTYDPAFGPAARAALKEVRFHPAIRNGQPVPFTLRMTVEFTDPASQA